jgi:hypothetical protein
MALPESGAARGAQPAPRADLIFHLGLAKTASSFIQKVILRGKILTLSRAIDRDEDRALSMEFWRAFRQSEPGYWAGPGAALFGRHDPAHGPVLISHESLHDHNPFRGDGLPAGMEREPAVLAGRLAAIARHAWPHGTLKAWFFFRRQAEWLASIYAHSCWQLPDPSQQNSSSARARCSPPRRPGSSTMRCCSRRSAPRSGRTMSWRCPMRRCTSLRHGSVSARSPGSPTSRRGSISATARSM